MAKMPMGETLVAATEEILVEVTGVTGDLEALALYPSQEHVLQTVLQILLLLFFCSRFYVPIILEVNKKYLAWRDCAIE